MNPIDELESASQIADARLGVAEEFRWPMAVFSAVVCHLVWHSWLAAGAAFLVVFVLVSRPYRLAADKAEDEFFKAARLGKYASARQHQDASTD